VKEVFEEEEKEEDFEDNLNETQEEVVEKVDEGEMLVLRRVLGELKTSKERTSFILVVRFKGRYVLLSLMEEAVLM